MGDTSETNTKVLSRELFLGVVALKTPIQKNHYLHDKVPFRKSGHRCICIPKQLYSSKLVIFFSNIYSSDGPLLQNIKLMLAESLVN